MKKVVVTYFKTSGKYYTHETIEIPEETNGYHALFEVIPPLLHLNDEMVAVIRDSGDGKEPYIVPHMYDVHWVRVHEERKQRQSQYKPIH